MFAPTQGGPHNEAAALLLQSRMAELYAVDIHPGATIGDGVMLDHANGVVIGATAILGDDICKRAQNAMSSAFLSSLPIAPCQPPVSRRCMHLEC